MYDHEIHSRQLTAWLLGAMIPTVIQLTAGGSWLSLLLASVLCTLCVWFRWSFGKEPQGKWINLFWIGLMALLLGTAAERSVSSWPTGGHPLASGVLVLLAAWSAWKGTDAAARVGCVLFWFVLLLYLLLLGIGLKEVNMTWIIPTKGDVDPMGCILLLTPAAAAIHLGNKRGVRSRLLIPGILCTVSAVITAGILSPEIASQEPNAFYEMSRTLSLFGQARHFEAILSASMTVGWFSVFSLYLTICATTFEKLKKGKGSWGILSATAVALGILLCQLHIPTLPLLVLCAIFWVLIPVLTQWVDVIKKVEKSENSA